MGLGSVCLAWLVEAAVNKWRFGSKVEQMEREHCKEDISGLWTGRHRSPWECPFGRSPSSLSSFSCLSNLVVLLTFLNILKQRKDICKEEILIGFFF